MKIVINRCYGGFGLSEKAMKYLKLPLNKYIGYYDRTDPKLIKCVEKLGDKVNDSCSKLEIVEIPDGTKYEIRDYDGMETVEELHNSWS